MQRNEQDPKFLISQAEDHELLPPAQNQDATPVARSTATSADETTTAINATVNGKNVRFQLTAIHGS